MDRHRFPDWVIDICDKLLEDNDCSQYGQALREIRSKAGYEGIVALASGGLSSGSSPDVYPNVLLPNGTLTQTISRPSSSNRIFQITSGPVLTKGFELTGTATNNWSSSGSSAMIGLTSSVSAAYSLTDSCNFYGLAFSYFSGNANIYPVQKQSNSTSLNFGSVMHSFPFTTGSIVFSLRCLDITTNVIEYRYNNGAWTVLPGFNVTDLVSDRLCLAFDNYNETGSNINFTVSITS